MGEIRQHSSKRNIALLTFSPILTYRGEDNIQKGSCASGGMRLLVGFLRDNSWLVFQMYMVTDQSALDSEVFEKTDYNTISHWYPRFRGIYYVALGVESERNSHSLKQILFGLPERTGRTELLQQPVCCIMDPRAENEGTILVSENKCT
ncbi:hypothetical protein YC2023_091043 [Brassica napus]